MNRLFSAVTVLLLTAVMLYAGDGKKYGDDLTLKETTKVSEILEHPEKYEGKKVLIEGTIVDVCPTRGCWINVSSDKGYETIKVKVNDGEIVFPMEAKGKTALVEGEVYSFIPAIQEEHKHAESEKIEKANKAECGDKTAEGGCCSGETKVTKVYQIKGLGAVVKS